MRCVDCRYWTPFGGSVVAIGRCDITLPPGLNAPPEERAVNADHGCDLGLPPAEEGAADADS